jgi:hypothetical protein
LKFCTACSLTANLSLTFATTRQSSVSQSFYLIDRTLTIAECHLLSINMQSIWLWVFPSREVQGYLFIHETARKDIFWSQTRTCLEKRTHGSPNREHPCLEVRLMTVPLLLVAAFAAPLPGRAIRRRTWQKAADFHALWRVVTLQNLDNNRRVRYVGNKCVNKNYVL